MALALSRYNVYLEEPMAAGETGRPRLLVFNTLRGGLVALRLGRPELEALAGAAASLPGSGAFPAATSPEAGPIAGDGRAELLETLRGRGFLVRQGHDELAAYLATRAEHLASTSVMRLTLLPTLFCNFRCTYCYESLAGPAMDDETEARLGRFVVRSVKAGGLKVLDVNWFGGEPLLEWDRMLRLTAIFREACAEQGVVYQAGVATNGYLVDAGKAADLRDELSVRSVVVTLDGPPASHDKRRLHRTGGPTFARILAGLEDLAAEGHNIGLQVNCDDSTAAADFEELLARLASVRQRVTLHLRWVFPRADRWHACGHDRASHGRTGKAAPRAHDSILSLARAAVACGFRVRNPVLHPKVAFCNTEYRNHWVVHPTGQLYKCNVEFELGQPCGALESDGRITVDEERVEGWLGKDLLADERCRSCVWLPVCAGGCAFARRGRSDPSCPRGQPDRLADYVLLEYEQRKGDPRP